MTCRSILPLMLALMLALTSQSMAVARGAVAVTGQMVLCTGTGPVAVYVDATGQPTSAPHICPDSAMNVVGGDAAALLDAPFAISRFAPYAVTAVAQVPGVRRPAPPSRAPPFSV